MTSERGRGTQTETWTGMRALRWLVAVHLLSSGCSAADGEGGESSRNVRSDGSEGEQATSRWTRLLGTPDDDGAFDSAADGSGNLYVAGMTRGDLGWKSNSGNFDAYLAKYDAAGNRLWVEQIGTPSTEEVAGVSIGGSGDLYVAGTTKGDLEGRTNRGKEDAFVKRWK